MWFCGVAEFGQRKKMPERKNLPFWEPGKMGPCGQGEWHSHWLNPRHSSDVKGGCRLNLAKSLDIWKKASTFKKRGGAFCAQGCELLSLQKIVIGREQVRPSATPHHGCLRDCHWWSLWSQSWKRMETVCSFSNFTPRIHQIEHLQQTNKISWSACNITAWNILLRRSSFLFVDTRFFSARKSHRIKWPKIRMRCYLRLFTAGTVLVTVLVLNG